MLQMKQTLFLVAFAAVVMLMLLLGNPYSDEWFLKCPLHSLTGLQCPFCGMQRQLHSLMLLDWREAWRLNQGLLICYPYLAVLALSQISTTVRNSKIGIICNSNIATLTFMALMILWAIARNII